MYLYHMCVSVCHTPQASFTLLMSAKLFSNQFKKDSVMCRMLIDLQCLLKQSCSGLRMVKFCLEQHC